MAPDEPERWPVTDDDRRDAINALMRLVRSDDGPLVIRAVRILARLDAESQRQELQADRELRDDLVNLLEANE
ncbi:hypothetical protein [Rosistilla oblonga]|uniref:hypothetical protein n=1 Tax=Rosistilla oblonga TaxID=2527990 RepID=UPI003A96D642